jgi:CubicO group peptidase (beta-lactamase class C family)
MDEAGLSPGPNPPPVTADEYMKRLGSLPLAFQPGEKWLYHTGIDVLGVLIARAAGQPLEEVLAGRLLRPLSMKDTGFHVPAAKLDRLTAAYRPDPRTGALTLSDDPRDTPLTQPPPFPAGGSGLVSTADDLLAFCTMMLNKGRRGPRRVLSRPSVLLMTSDQLTPQQQAENALFFSDGAASWGFGLSVVIRRSELAGSPGRFGWNGGRGTSVYVDPAEELIGILLTQREMTSPLPPDVFSDFWTCAYQAIDD